LSNPSYAAFYPPSWLVFAVPPHYLFSVLAFLHGAIAFAGAWRLARRFGCNRGTAALAAVGYAGGGAYLSLLSAYTLYCSMAWFPWALAWADAALRAEGRAWWRPALLAGGAIALQLLNGEPSTVVMSGLGVLALAASAALRRPAGALRAAVPVLFAVALAAVQLLPTLGRLADSPRKDIPTWHATLWSMPPERLAEVVFPRFFGDPARNMEGVYFGWKLEDRDYSYVESIYPGLLLALLGLAALIRWPIPRRGAWALAVLAGVFLALGRNNSIYEALRRAVPVLAVLRFPEKFAVFAVLALGIAGVLGWQRLLDEREEGRPETADLPLALAGVVLATALFFALLLLWNPRSALGFVAAHGAPDLGPGGVAAGVSYLRAESWGAVITSVLVAALLALCRWRRPSRRLLEGLAVALLAADLWHYGHGLIRTLPASAYTVPPPLAASILPAEDRVFVQPPPPGAPETVPRGWGDPRTLIARTSIARLEPYSGLLWHLPYAFNNDFDLMLTGWGRQAQAILDTEWGQPQMAYRYLGVWNVGTLLLRAPSAPVASRDPAATLRRVPNTYLLPRFRFVPRVSFHPDVPGALLSARTLAWQVNRHEQCIRPNGPAETVAFRQPPRLLSFADAGGRIDVHYQAGEGGGLFVAGMTYDRGWRATLDGAPLEVYPTAACQIAVRLPAGEHRLELRYHERLLGAGAAVTLLSLAAGLGFLLKGRRRHLA
ncbi:MAG TPA: YfhO family protein, partial [Thermoanaerobaculia bacterium]